MSEILRVENLTKNYVTQSESLSVLKGVNLSVQSGQRVCVIGESGNGKSTLLNVLGGIDTASGGRVVAGPYELTKMSEDELTEYRSTFVGLIFQFHYLLKDFSALENIFLPAYMAGVPKAQAMEKAKKLLADEPTGNLDPANAAMIGDLLFDMTRRYNKSLLLVTHDMGLAQKGDRLCEMKDGVLNER